MSVTATPKRRVGAQRPSPTSRIVGALGEVLLTLGIVVGLYIAWQVWWTDVGAQHAQQEIIQEMALPAPWPHSPDGSPAVGTEHRDAPPVLTASNADAYGILRVPAWGSDYAVPIADGTTREVLNTVGLGRYENTQNVGDVGNVGIAGHRTSYGKPLRGVADLVPGDALVVEGADTYYVYRVLGSQIVNPQDGQVLAPVPPVEGAVEGGRYLTLTTCHPIYGTTERYIVWASLDSWTPKTEGLPPALTEVE